MQSKLSLARNVARLFVSSRAVRRIAFLVSALLLLLAVAAPALEAQFVGSAGRVTLETLSPDALLDATDAGALSRSQLLTLTLTLAPPSSRSVALTQFLNELQSTSSPNYRKFITPAEFAATYGPTADQIATVDAWAQSAGLTVTATSTSGMRMTVTGYPAQVEAAFALSLHQYQVAGHSYFANGTQPSVPTALAALITSVEGLEDLPADLETYSKGPGTTPGTLVNGTPTALTIAALAPAIDENLAPFVMLDATKSIGSLSAAQHAADEALFRQAAAEGITTLLTRDAASQGFPSDLPEITAVAKPGDVTDTQKPTVMRPGWQSVPGLPADQFRHAPDLTATSVATLASTLSSIAASLPGGRLGNVNSILYELAEVPGLYTQGDDVKEGTWEASTGLGLVDLEKLAKAFPRGTTSSFASLSLSSYSVTYGTPVTFTSNVTSGAGGTVPSGTVTFALGNGTNLTAPVTSGVASYTTTPTQLDAGTYSVQANYSGDGTYAAAQSPAGQLYISPQASVLSASVSTNATLGGTYNVNVTDTSGNGIGQPTGNITLLVQGTQTSLTQPLTAGTGATASTIFQVPANIVGTLTLSINCTTTTDFTCFNPYTTKVTVAKGIPGITISYTPNLPVAGQTITLNATMTGAGSGPTPTGSVTFYDGSTVLNSADVAANGTVTETGIVPNTTIHTITATYNGDANYNPVTTSGSSVAGGSTATSTSLTPSAVTVSGGQAFTLAIAVTPKTLINNTQPTGLVQILDNSAVIGTAPALASGATSYTLSFPTAGANSLTAYYPGDANYASSTSAATVITVSSASTVAVLASTISAATAKAGSSVNVTATVTLPGGTPTGLVTATILTTGTSSSVSGTLSANVGMTGASTTIPLTVPAAGSYQIVVGCPATDAFTCNAVDLSLTSTGSTTLIATTTTLSLAPATPLAGQPFALTAMVTPATTGAAAVSGTVLFFNGATQIGSGTISGGTATTTVTLASVKNASFAAVYSGDTNYLPSTSTPSSVSSTIVPATVTVSASGATGLAGTNVTLTAQVSGATTSGTAPTGKVSFYVDGTVPALLGTATLTAGTGGKPSIAQLNTEGIPAGTQTIYAVYSGDMNFATGVSASIAVGYSDYGVAFSPANITLTQGQTGIVALQVNTTAGFSGTIALACTPPPNSLITCSLSESSLSGSGTSTLTINTVADVKAENHLPGFKTLGGLSLAALVSWLLPFKKRRRLSGLLLVLLAFAVSVELSGCAASTVGTPIGGGTPLGTETLTINTSATSAGTVISHDSIYQVTIIP